MMIMDYSSISGEYLLDYAKKSTWNLFHAYMNAHRKMLIYEYPRYGSQAITRLKS